jgi:hypothetical protein
LTDHYAGIIGSNIETLFRDLPEDFGRRIGARTEGRGFVMNAFGKSCSITSGGILMNGVPETGVEGILVSLYAIRASAEPLVLEPFIAFREVPGSAPYVSAFVDRSAAVLVPQVTRIKAQRESLNGLLGGMTPPADLPGDFSMLLFPLPKIGACYIFHEADEEFPASVTCLFSHNAPRFMPVDGLADVGEYTAKAILNHVKRFGG